VCVCRVHSSVLRCAAEVLQRERSLVVCLVVQVVLGLQAVSAMADTPVSVRVLTSQFGEGSKDKLRVSVSDVFGEPVGNARVVVVSATRPDQKSPLVSSKALTAATGARRCGVQSLALLSACLLACLPARSSTRVAAAAEKGVYELDFMSFSPPAAVYAVKLSVSSLDKPSKFAAIDSYIVDIKVVGSLKLTTATVRLVTCLDVHGGVSAHAGARSVSGCARPCVPRADAGNAPVRREQGPVVLVHRELPQRRAGHPCWCVRASLISLSTLAFCVSDRWTSLVADVVARQRDRAASSTSPST
jgi:hypothetical protein